LRHGVELRLLFGREERADLIPLTLHDCATILGSGLFRLLHVRRHEVFDLCLLIGREGERLVEARDHLVGIHPAAAALFATFFSGGSFVSFGGLVGFGSIFGANQRNGREKAEDEEESGEFHRNNSGARFWVTCHRRKPMGFAARRVVAGEVTENSARACGGLVRPAALDPMLEVQGLTKRYGTFTAVRDLSFVVRPGEVLGLVGPNGAGKTSTLRCLSGIIPMNGGFVRVAGHDLATAPVAAKRELAFFADEPRLFDYLTVRQHLAFVARIYGVTDHEAISQPLLEELEIADKADQLPTELSRGMKQKLAIACGLLHAPKVMFFDEPLTGLDPLGIRRMKDSIIKRAQAGATIVLSSHLLHLLEEVCTHVLILKRGEKIALGSLSEVAAQFGSVDPDVSLEQVYIRATEGPGT
jgi:ABC-2 type transport system ATP-binding protein